MVGPLVTMMPLHQASHIKYLGVTSPVRLAAFPDTPTLIEQGYRIQDNGWLGVCGGNGIPHEVITTINQHVVKAVSSQEFRNVVERTGVIPASSSPGELNNLIRETAADMEQLAAELKLKVN